MVLFFLPPPGQSNSQSPQCFPSWGTSVFGWISIAHHGTLLSDSTVVHLLWDTPLYLNGNTHSWLPTFASTPGACSSCFFVLQGANNIRFPHASYHLLAYYVLVGLQYLLILPQRVKQDNPFPQSGWNASNPAPHSWSLAAAHVGQPLQTSVVNCPLSQHFGIFWWYKKEYKNHMNQRKGSLRNW